MKVVEKEDEILISYIPFKRWIISGILSFIFVIFFIWAYFFSAASLNELPALISELSLLTFIFIAAVAVFSFFIINFVMLIFAPLVTVAINRKTKTVEIIKQRFYVNKRNLFYFSQVQKFKSDSSKLRNKRKYSLVLVLANKDVIQLQISLGSDKNETVKVIRKLNKFIKSAL